MGVPVSLLVMLLLLISWSSTFVLGLPGPEDPFQNEADQCEIRVSSDLMKTLSDSLKIASKCEDLWSDLLNHLDETHYNLTACLERKKPVTLSPSTSFCQVVVDDAQRQIEQEHRKYAAEMEQKLHDAKQKARDHHDEMVALQNQYQTLVEDRSKLYLDLLQMNIAIGDVPQALIYYRLCHDNVTTQQKLFEKLVRSVYRLSKYQDQRLYNLMKVVKRLNVIDERVALFRLIKVEILKRPSQRDGNMAAIYGLNAKSDALDTKDEKLYKDVQDPIEKRWKDQIVTGNFREVTNFAAKHPDYFKVIQYELVMVDAREWSKMKFDLFIEYPNALPKSEQKLEALRVILELIKHRNGNSPYDYLVQTAKQFHKCEEAIKKSKPNNEINKMLDKVRNMFGTFSSGKDYSYYLNESKKRTSG